MALKSALINVMTAAATKAARGLIRDFGEVEQLQVSRKGPANFVSAADARAEQVLIAELRRARPEFGFVAEESGIAAGADPRRNWHIDPLDGTTNFLHGMPHFCISVGLAEDDEIIAGIVYEPLRDEMFWAEKGQGAYLNGRRLRVSARENLADAVIATGIPHLGRPDHQAFLGKLQSVMAVTAGVRRFGAAALDLAYVAAGRFDGFWESNLSSWDIAAGVILVREAGGFVTDLAGRSEVLKRGEVVAATDKLHAPLRTLLRGAPASPSS